MDLISRLPYIMGILAAIFTGLISFSQNTGSSVLYRRMLISMVVFFLIGVYLKSTLEQILKEVELRKKEEMLQLQEKLEKEAAAQKKINEAKSGEAKPPSTIDYRIDDSNEEFTPLKASKVISRQLDK